MTKNTTITYYLMCSLLGVLALAFPLQFLFLEQYRFIAYSIGILVGLIYAKSTYKLINQVCLFLERSRMPKTENPAVSTNEFCDEIMEVVGEYKDYFRTDMTDSVKKYHQDFLNFGTQYFDTLIKIEKLRFENRKNVTEKFVKLKPEQFDKMIQDGELEKYTENLGYILRDFRLFLQSVNQFKLVETTENS